jgi:hypothetical protein
LLEGVLKMKSKHVRKTASLGELYFGFHQLSVRTSSRYDIEEGEEMRGKDEGRGLREKLTGADTSAKAKCEVWFKLGIGTEEAFRPEYERVGVGRWIMCDSPVVYSVSDEDEDPALSTKHSES